MCTVLETEVLSAAPATRTNRRMSPTLTQGHTGVAIISIQETRVSFIFNKSGYGKGNQLSGHQIMLA